MGGLFCYILVAVLTFYSISKHWWMPRHWRVVFSAVWPLWWFAVMLEVMFY